MTERNKTLLLWIVIATGLFLAFSSMRETAVESLELPYSRFLAGVDKHEVASATFHGPVISGPLTNGKGYVTYSPETDNTALIGQLRANRVSIAAAPPARPSVLWELFLACLPVILLAGVWVFFLRKMQGQGGPGGNGVFGFGRSRARLLTGNEVAVTFADVAGVDEAKEDVKEIVDFLREPAKFQKLGGRIPKGVLMVGSPGTGKTLLARAIAGEAGVPFFTISGSDFVEMFVGVGASRVRDLFVQAKRSAPCIIFIDEIDAVGRQRGAGVGGGHDEREQTLNQMLVEMDGFAGNEGIIVIAATNRPDVLDPALLRPGRFDRQVVVGLPDVRGREQILKVHLRKVPADAGVRVDVLARGTPGFSGADLANLVNEAALLAARANRRSVTMAEFEQAKDKILMGAERRSMVMSDHEKWLTAVHEAGHAIVGLTVPGHDPVYKVTIIPRGRALGVTTFLPEADRYSTSKRQLQGRIATLFGGRMAEELFFGAEGVTTGASSDIERATEIARSMVTKWGLSERLGPQAYAEDEGEVFLGRTVARHKQVSDETARAIDEEVRLLIDEGYETAREILTERRATLQAMADALMVYETIDEEQLADLMAGREPRPPREVRPSSPPPGTPPASGDTAIDWPALASRLRPDAPGSSPAP